MKKLVAVTMAAGFAWGGCGEDDKQKRTPEEVREARRMLLEASDEYDFADPPPTTADDCDVTLSASGEKDANALLEAVEDADSYTTICLEPGEYAMNRSIVVSSAQGLTVKGIGDKPEDTVLDFAEHTGDKGFDVTTPGFWIENLYVKNTTGNGVEVKAEGSEDNPTVFRKLKVGWDVPDGAATDCREDDPRRDHGAYSIYPTLSSYVVVEFCEVEGASDAGLYVGSVEHGVVRHNRVHGNVAGLEVENSSDVDVYDNEAFDNSGGVLALQEPGLARLTNENVLIRDNDVHDNNGCNFAKPNTTVANIPPGTGMMSFAGSNIEFRDNDVRNNKTTGLLLVSNILLDLLSDRVPEYPEDYDPYAHDIFVNGNDFTNNATAPQGQAALIAVLVGGFEDVVWDGYTMDPGDVEGAMICLNTEPPTFLDLTQGECPALPESQDELIGCMTANLTRDTANYECKGSIKPETF